MTIKIKSSIYLTYKTNNSKPSCLSKRDENINSCDTLTRSLITSLPIISYMRRKPSGRYIDKHIVITCKRVDLHNKINTTSDTLIPIQIAVWIDLKINSVPKADMKEDIASDSCCLGNLGWHCLEKNRKELSGKMEIVSVSFWIACMRTLNDLNQSDQILSSFFLKKSLMKSNESPIKIFLKYSH